MVYSSVEQNLIREDVFRWLDEQMVRQGSPELTRELLLTYKYKGVAIPLLDTSRGIRNPKQLDSTLTVMTSIKEETGYADQIQANGLIQYSLRAQDPYQGDNKKLFHAYQTGVPLVYFEAIRAGVYVAHYPVYVKIFEAETSFVYLEPDEEFKLYGDPAKLVTIEKEYVERVVKQRKHQRFFRAEVLEAYNSVCSVCRLSQYTLIDAAHIIPDRLTEGIASVTNGLALCKLHHAAYDQDILGISPSYEIHIRADLLNSSDHSKSLKANFIDLHKNALLVPEVTSRQPDRERLEANFEKFLLASG